jgi:hypothetical protein
LLVALLHLAHSLTHLSFEMLGLLYRGGEQALHDAISRCTRLTSLHLRCADINAGLVNCLARLPLLQRLHLHGGHVSGQTASAWAELRSLRELQIDLGTDADNLLRVLSSAPALCLLRWVCNPPTRVPLDEQYSSSGPTHASLSGLLTVAPLLRVQLVMPHMAQWRYTLLSC